MTTEMWCYYHNICEHGGHCQRANLHDCDGMAIGCTHEGVKGAIRCQANCVLPGQEAPNE